MNKESLLASEIDDCSICPIEKECHASAHPCHEPPCTSWNGNEEIYEGWLEEEYLLREEAWERQLKQERSFQAKHNAQIRKQYSHLDQKAKKFKEWLPKSNWQLIVTSRKKDRIYMRGIGKRKANWYFNLEKEQLCVCQGKVTLLDLNTFNIFENDFKEYYYGERPEDRNFFKEAIDRVHNHFKEFDSTF